MRSRSSRAKLARVSSAPTNPALSSTAWVPAPPVRTRSKGKFDSRFELAERVGNNPLCFFLRLIAGACSQSSRSVARCQRNVDRLWRGADDYCRLRVFAKGQTAAFVATKSKYRFYRRTRWPHWLSFGSRLARVYSTTTMAQLRLLPPQGQTEIDTVKTRQAGFSLIELLIVVAIILIIAAIAIPNLMRSRMAANESSAAASERSIVTGEVTFNSTYPTTGFAPNLLALGGPLGAACVP